MDKNMKQIRLFLYAAISVLAVASCAREEIVAPGPQGLDGKTSVLTLSFDQTKTALVGGKTTWVAGDKIRIYNGTATFYQDVAVPESETGKASAQIEVNMADSVYYAVYPANAAKSCAVGKVSVTLPTNPDGLFSSANICVAKSNGTSLQMRNVTAVLKVNINSGNVIEILQVNAKNPMVGTCEVDLTGTDPVVELKDGTKSATVAIGGVDGDYYIAVAPGTYAEEFSVTALRGNGGFQTLKSTQANDIAINTIVPLGTIGNDLSKGLNGEGTEASPYVISNLGEWGAFVASVNLGNPYEGKYVKLDTDIEDGVATPIGFYLASDEQAPFAGIFQGNNHNVKLDLQGENCKSQNYVALFGVVGPGTSITDLKLSGTVEATGKYVAGLVGYASGTAASRITVKGINSSVKVKTSGEIAGGIIGLAEYADVESCINTGAVEGKFTVGGVAGYLYQSDIKDCGNSGAITDIATEYTSMYLISQAIYSKSSSGNTYYTANDWNCGVGGVVGYAQNTPIKDVVNAGTVDAYMKLGGIAGQAYWSNITGASNTGAITGSGSLDYRADTQNGLQYGSVAGGIVGYANTYSVISECTNTAQIKGKGGIGGIVGNIVCSNNASSTVLVQNCTNSGAIVGVSVYNGGTRCNANPGTGGIVGNMFCYSTYVGKVFDCVNRGEVTATGYTGKEDQANGVGGIVGRSFNGRNTLNGDAQINRCVNEANVTGGFWVGGILGMGGARYAMQTSVLNCANHGTIKAIGICPKDPGMFVGGIAGGCNSYNTNYRNRAHLRVNNCYNDGDVLYAQEDYVKPHAGGIVGDVWANDSQKIQNNYNIGRVGTVSGADPAEGASDFIGAIAGRQNGNFVHYCYFPKDVLPAVGANGTAANATTVVAFDAEGNLAMPVTANKIDCTTLLQVLNEWQNYYVANGYFNWTGPAAHPVFDTTQD